MRWRRALDACQTTFADVVYRHTLAWGGLLGEAGLHGSLNFEVYWT